MYNPRVLAAGKILLTAAKTRCPDTLEHETLGYKRGHISHFEGEEEIENCHNLILERETLRESDFLEFSPKI